MKTVVAILNWNTCAYLERWLPMLLGSIAGGDACVVVADNGSRDGSVAMLGSRFPGVRVIAFNENYGFTGGYNRAVADIAAHENPEYIVLLNSDVETAPGWLEPLVSWMDTHPGCGVCGPKIHALEKDGQGYRRSSRFEYAGAAGGCIDRFGFPFCRGRVGGRTENDEGQYDSPRDVLWTSGACLVTRIRLWRELDGLDERFFAHMEEIDLCWRIALAGYSVTTVPQSTVWHLGGGTLPQSSPFKLKLNFRNNLLLLDNNLGRSIGSRRAAAIIFIRKVLDLGAAAAFLLGGRRDNARAVIDAHREYRHLRRRPDGVRKHSKIDIKGLLPICILFQSAIKGDKIFKYLLDYEHNN